MDFTLSVNMDNAAFEHDPAPELARILRRLASELERDMSAARPQDYSRRLMDRNGNGIGKAEVTL